VNLSASAFVTSVTGIDDFALSHGVLTILPSR
jgi:hypothetical protein